jgi:hypothetical protein
MKRRFGRLTLVAVLLASTAILEAADGRDVTIPERTRGAQKVVIGSVASVTPVWRHNGRGDHLIVSEVVVNVEETLKGAPAKTVKIDVEGGTLDGMTLRVSSMEPLNPRDRAVFFLDSSTTGSDVPHLKGQGILKLDAGNQVAGSSMRLDDLRRQVLSAGR